MASEFPDGRLLVGTHQGAVAGNICGENGGKAPLRLGTIGGLRSLH
jgi:hypothetical protein